MTTYTDVVVAQMVAIGSFTYESALEFAAEHDLKPRSVISKIKSLGLEYTPKATRVTKSGTPVVAKEEVAILIEQKLGLEMPSLRKMTKADLVRLAKLIATEA